MVAQIRADWRARGDRRATLAAWAARQPAWRRALVLAAAGALAACVFAVLFSAFPARELNAYGRPARPPRIGVVVRAVAEVVGGGAASGLAYAAVAAWLLDARRARRWAAGAAVGAAWALGVVARPSDRPAALGWGTAAGFVLLNALLGVVLAVPPAWAADEVRASARVV